jgi:hypothetical protein
MRNANDDSSERRSRARMSRAAGGRHAASHAAPQGGAQQPRQAHVRADSARTAAGSGASSHYVPMDMEEEAPRASSAPMDSLGTLSSGQGARVTTRENAAEAADIARDRAAKRAHDRRLRGDNRPRYSRQHQQRISNRTVAIVIGAIAVLALVLLIVSCVSSSAADQAAQQQAEEQQAQQTEQQQSQSTSSTDTSVSYQDVSFSIQQQEDGTYGVVANDGTSSDTLVFTVSGTPVTLIMYNSVIIVPENLSDGTWDVIAYTLGGDSDATRVVDSSGNAVTGTGTLTEATLDGSVVHVTDSDGNTTDVSLE